MRVLKLNQKSAHGMIVTFCLKLQQCKFLKLALMILNFVLRFSDQKWQKSAQSKIFQVFCQNNDAQNFSDFLHNLIQVWNWLNQFFEKTLILSLLGQKCIEMGGKLGFQDFQNINAWIFL